MRRLILILTILFACVLFPPAANATWAHLADCSSGTGLSNDSCSLNTSGATLVVLTVSNDQTAPGSPFGNNGGCSEPAATLIDTINPGATNSVRIYVFSPLSCAGASWIAQCGGFNNTCVGSAFSGTAAGTLVEFAGGNATFATTNQPGSYTPLCTNELMVWGTTTADSGTAPSVTSGGTYAGGNGFNNPWRGSGQSWVIQTTATAFNPTWDNHGVSTWFAIAAVSLKEASSVCAGGKKRHRVVSSGE